MRVTAKAAFYVVADRRFFPGLVGLVNSLRLQGHSESVVVLDCGLTHRQREQLQGNCRLVPFDRSQATSPSRFKPFAHLLHARGLVVVVDSAVIVTAPLNDLFDRARAGRICVALDPEEDRWFSEWEDVFGLRKPLRRGRYVNSSFVAFSADHWPGLLGRWWEACRRTWRQPWFYETGAPDGPAAQGGQDALNALLMSEVPEESVWYLATGAAPIGEAARGVRVQDLATLRCECGGQRTLLMQSVGALKPWEGAYWKRFRGDAYSVLLRRLLLGEGLALRVDEAELPLWLRRGLTTQAVWQVLVWANTNPARPWVGRSVRWVRSGYGRWGPGTTGILRLVDAEAWVSDVFRGLGVGVCG